MNIYGEIWHWLFVVGPVAVPLILINIAWNVRLNYLRRRWINERYGVTLEVRLPRDIVRSPAAMEFFLHGIYEPIVGTAYDAFFEGRVRDWFSLEIASDGGDVRFYIWGPTLWKKIIETRIYDQYPGAEVTEVPDYTKGILYDPESMKLWATQLELVKPDAYPIKTYIDYGLDKVSSKEEEEKIDPLTPVLEFMGSLKPGEKAWMQILIQPHRKEGFKDGLVFFKKDWKDAAKAEIKKIIEKESYVKPDGDKPTNLLGLSEGQKDAINAIERSLGKMTYDTMIRLIIMGDKEVYDKMNPYGFVGSFRQFQSNNLNGLKPDLLAGRDHPLSDFRGTLGNRQKKQILDAYKRRSFFNIPYKNWQGKRFIMTVEELATIFHFPGKIASTPTLARIPSKKAEAPANLPV